MLIAALWASLVVAGPGPARYKVSSKIAVGLGALPCLGAELGPCRANQAALAELGANRLVTAGAVLNVVSSWSRNQFTLSAHSVEDDAHVVWCRSVWCSSSGMSNGPRGGPSSTQRSCACWVPASCSPSFTSKVCGCVCSLFATMHGCALPTLEAGFCVCSRRGAGGLLRAVLLRLPARVSRLPGPDDAEQGSLPSSERGPGRSLPRCDRLREFTMHSLFGATSQLL